MNPQTNTIPANEAFTPAQQMNFPSTQPFPSPVPMTQTELAYNPLIQQQEAQTQAGLKQRESSLSNISQTFSQLMGVQGSRSSLEESQGIPQLQTQLADIDSLMQIKTQRLSNELQSLEGQNVPVSFIRGQQNRLNTEATRELANLAVVRNSKLGRLEAAQAWVDRKIEAEIEPLKTRLQYEQFVYNENKDILNDAQKKAFELKLKKTETELNDTKELKQQVNNIALEAAKYGASPEVVNQIGNAQSYKDAIAIGSKFLGEPFKLQVDMQEFQKRIQLAQLDLQRQKFSFDTAQMTQEELAKKQEEIKQSAALEADAEKKIKSIDEALGKAAGIETAAGSTALGRGFASVIGQVLTSPIRTGNLAGGADSIRGISESREVTAAVGQLLASDWVKGIQEAKARGATFGALSDAENTKISNAANALAGVVITNRDGQVTGFRSSPEFVVQQLLDIRQTYEEIKNRRADEFVLGVLGTPQATDSSIFTNAGY